ncbi:uncharacterized protein FOBCDRAFT_288992 [Fusarium oxysporum Fo47]|uniref:uncharacterized protein n=1 Tax=Fusarium oxysporum Fo47 TaxID=660027 RepID=UPI002869A6C5|nr:uncharacterized protein FOBCDRAFT_288992 [Fusarium oxysporum Fo47]QKD50054.2 hypothetical protein FOBCDRAFT_288992 [Fusarium oxysporum Fo47]
MLCFKGSKGYKVVPKKKKVKAATSTSTSTNQTSAPRTRNGTGTGTAAVTQPTNRVAAKSTRPSPDRSRNPPYSNSRASPSRRHNSEQGPPIQPPRQQSKVARTNNMASQNGIFYGRVDSAITSGFEDDESATAVQNPTSKSQGSSSSNTAQSQAYDTTPASSTQAPFRYQRPSFLDDFDFTAESRRDLVVAHGVTSALSPRQGYHPTPASILNFADFDLENTDTKISDIRHDRIPSHERPIINTAVAAAASSSSSSSASPYVDLPESLDSDATTTRAIDRRECIVCSDIKATDSFPDFVTSKCTHTPSICLDCMERSIQVGMKSKRWTDIRCDECQENLEYNDIQRFADEQTIAKYERQALRAAVEEDENFFWCTSDCGSGQIHDSGSAQPIVVCIKCSHRSCFRHGVNWHEDLSCEEYDRLQEDPDFRGHLELENERWSKAQAAQAAQEEADRDLARRFVAKEKAKIKHQEAQDQRERERERERQKSQRERERERQKYQERRRELEREKQERQRVRVRERQKNQERQRELERERQERQRALREKASAQKAAEERRQIAARRKIEEAKSIATLRATTKPCGGCGWAIEKNSGCSHMTCRKCNYQFCWTCGKPWSRTHLCLGFF